MILMTISSSSLSWLAWELFFSVMAALGGIIVFWGLWIEKKADKKWYPNVDDFRSFKREAERGWKILMIGIIVEIVVGVWFAVRDGWEIRQINANAVKSEPLNQRIFAFSAYAKLIVRPLEPVNDFETLPKNPWALNWSFKRTDVSNGAQTVMYLGQSRRMATGDIGRTQIASESIFKSAAIGMDGQFLRFDIHFGFDSDDFSNDSLTPNEFDAIDLLVPIHCEIISGEVEMSIDNGLVRKTFQIPKQTTIQQAATSVATNGTFVPIDFDPEIRAEFGKNESKLEELRHKNLEFQTRGLELEMKAHEGKANDRTITDEQRDVFIKLLSEYPKTPVKVFVSAGDDEAARYAQKIRQLLDAAGYGGNGGGIITNSNDITEGTNHVRWQPSSNMLAFVIYAEPTKQVFILAVIPFNDIKPLISSGFTNDAAIYAIGKLACV